MAGLCCSSVSPSVGSSRGASFDAGPRETVNRMIWLRESSSFIDSTACVKISLSSPTKRSLIDFPWTSSVAVPITSVHEGLTHRIVPSKLRSRITLSVCSAALRRSSLSSRISALSERAMASPPSSRSCVTTGGANISIPSSIVVQIPQKLSVSPLIDVPALCVRKPRPGPLGGVIRVFAVGCRALRGQNCRRSRSRGPAASPALSIRNDTRHHEDGC